MQKEQGVTYIVATEQIGVAASSDRISTSNNANGCSMKIRHND